MKVYAVFEYDVFSLESWGNLQGIYSTAEKAEAECQRLSAISNPLGATYYTYSSNELEIE